jgi:lipoprotein-anchoring transpeptidase ErfK/SrfK
MCTDFEQGDSMKLKFILLAVSLAFFAAGCAPQQTVTNNQPPANTNTAAAPTATPTPQATPAQTAYLPVTLPVLDAMFADENFADELKSKLNLSDEQIEKLKQTAREATANLDETDEGSTVAATRRAEEQIRGIIGEEKTRELAQMIGQRWAGEDASAFAAAGAKPNSVPTDTRVVVNAPAYRMDVFRDGQLVKTYKIGIGYPEFPLPTGLRRASEIIFNPTWTPPDEPWVKGKVQPGKTVEAGSKLNPLGPIKIPIGLPSLIHGGKAEARLGNFASHGCVGLTNQLVQDFSLVLAQISNTQLTAEDVKNYEKQKTETKNVKLAAPVPVELRYETIVVEDGKLKIFRDVYERGTNTEENLRKVLESHGVSFDQLTEQERAQILDGLKQMAVDAVGEPVAPNANANVNANTANNANKKNENSNSSGKVTRNIKGKKEVVFQLAALQGKGYPAPVA